jgi:Putative zinc-finger
VPAELLTWQWDSEPSRRFQRPISRKADRGCHLSNASESYRPVVFVSQKPCIIEIDCQQVRRELSNYLEGDLTAVLRLQIETHLAGCSHCAAIHDGVRNIVQLLGDQKLLEVPEGFGKRLYQRLVSEAK